MKSCLEKVVNRFNILDLNKGGPKPPWSIYRFSNLNLHSDTIDNKLINICKTNKEMAHCQIKSDCEF